MIFRGLLDLPTKSQETFIGGHTSSALHSARAPARARRRRHVSRRRIARIALGPRVRAHPRARRLRRPRAGAPRRPRPRGCSEADIGRGPSRGARRRADAAVRRLAHGRGQRVRRGAHRRRR